MDSTDFLTGIELEQLYLNDPSNDHLKNQQNLKTLFNHVLQKNMRELTDSDQEILDFCLAGLYPEEFPDKAKIQFLQDKYTVIAREKKKRRFYRSMQQAAACFVFMIIGGFMVYAFGGIESEAGIFDWVKDLFIEEDDSGEQLVISTPNATMEKIEMKEGHLPEKLPDGYVFEKSNVTDANSTSVYNYFFINPSNTEILIFIREFHDTSSLHKYMQEISKSSTKESTINDTTYYYSSNMQKNLISWASDYNIYSITSTTSFSELENIISYYDN